MIEIREVKSRKEIRQFIDLPLKIYAGSKEYVPALRMDEKNLFKPATNPKLKTCKIRPLLAYKDGKPAGRVVGLIQNLHFEKYGEKMVRFFNFDVYEDFDVAKALMDEVERWAREEHAVGVHGPLSFDDMEREGMLVEGFDTMGTFTTLYNYPYYPEFMEKLGYTTEEDWIQFRVDFANSDPKALARMREISNRVKQKMGFTVAVTKNRKELIEKYGKTVFDLINSTYSPLYGTVPLTDEVTKGVLKSFGSVLNNNLVKVVLNAEGEPIAFTLVFNSLSPAIARSKGKLFPLGFIRILRALKNYEVIDLGLMGILPEYQNSGVSAIMIDSLFDIFNTHHTKFFETNLTLVDNHKVHSLWRTLKHTQHKRNRSYRKNI